MNTLSSKTYFKRPAFKYYFFQLLSATAFIGLVLFIMEKYSINRLVWAVGASSLASSAYGVFMHPNGLPAKPKNIFLGYTIAVIVGELLNLALFALGLITHLPINELIASGDGYWFVPALSVTFVMILMAIFDIEHPPASGIALVLVVEMCRKEMVVMIYAFMLLLCFIQLIAKPYMRDLLR